LRISVGCGSSDAAGRTAGFTGRGRGWERAMNPRDRATAEVRANLRLSGVMGYIQAVTPRRLRFNFSVDGPLRWWKRPQVVCFGPPTP
jgi:hypothetical protein